MLKSCFESENILKGHLWNLLVKLGLASFVCAAVSLHLLLLLVHASWSLVLCGDLYFSCLEGKPLKQLL